MTKKAHRTLTALLLAMLIVLAGSFYGIVISGYLPERSHPEFLDHPIVTIR